MDFKIILLVLSLSYRFLHCNNDRWNQWKNGFSASFEIINIGRMYETLSPILHLDVYACAVECIRHWNCVTINHNHKTNQCELVDQKFDETEADTSNPDWANYGTPDKIDGKFSSWQKVGACSVTCETGTQMERRSCDNPQPRSGGKTCQGKTVRQVECDTNIPCPVHGSWSSWVANGFCSTCTRRRTCSAPSPRHNGLECLQSDNVNRSLSETVSPFNLCNITDYVQCDFIHQRNLDGGDIVHTFTLKTDVECIEFCYEKKQEYPQIVGLVTLDGGDHIKCYCKGQTYKVFAAKGHKFCSFKEVNLALSMNTSQSSTNKGDAAVRAVDGTRETWSKTNVEYPSWWIVEMKNPFLLLRLDLDLSGALGKYKDLRIKTKITSKEMWKLCTRFGSVSTQKLRNIQCKGHKPVMKYLRIENSNKLILHEVKIYGWPTCL